MILSRDQWLRLLRKGADLTDDEARAELRDIPLTLLQFLLGLDEYHLIDGGLFCGRGALAATAGVFSFVGIRNPVGSGVIVTVLGSIGENIAGAASNLQMVRPPTAATVANGTTTQCINTDSRRPSVASPVQLFTGNLAAIPGVNIAVQPNNDLNARILPVVLDEGSELIWSRDTVNIAVAAGFWGTFRPRSATQNAQV